jgi:hypothetical protein
MDSRGKGRGILCIEDFLKGFFLKDVSDLMKLSLLCKGLLGKGNNLSTLKELKKLISGFLTFFSGEGLSEEDVSEDGYRKCRWFLLLRRSWLEGI